MQKKHGLLFIMITGVVITACAESNLADEEAVRDTVDSGQVAAEELANIGGFVWLDEDEDGVYTEGEQRLDGVVVELLFANNKSVAAIPTLTDPSGAYNFFGMDESDEYQIRFELPEGYKFTKKDAGQNAVDSDAAEDGFTEAFEPLPGDNMIWSAGLVVIPKRIAFVTDAEAKQCEDLNIDGPIECEFAIRQFEAARKPDSNYTVFTIEFMDPFEALARDFCVYFDTKPDAGPTIAGLDGADVGYCWSGFDELVFHVELGGNGEWLSVAEPTENEVMVEAGETGPQGGSRLVLTIENSYLGLTEGRTKAYMLAGPTMYATTDWLEFSFSGAED